MDDEMVLESVGVAALGAVPTATFAAKNTKATEIVVVGSKPKKKGRR